MNVERERVLEALPVFTECGQITDWKHLQVEGLVSNPAKLNLDDLNLLPQHSLTEDFRCTHGWVVPELNWEGVLLRTILDMASPLPNSSYVSVTAGDYTIGLTLYEAYMTDVLVALKLNSETLTQDHGWPCRLIASGKLCHFNVKWIERIEITDSQPEDTGAAIVELKSASDKSELPTV